MEGYFSAKVLPGPKNITITYTGYKVLQLAVELKKDTTITFALLPQVGELEEVTVSANRYSQQHLVQSTRSGTTTLTKKDITAIPFLGGEADVIKTLQLLPGTVRGIEGSSDIFVRGGAADQNLVLLDGAPIYNTSHLFGFLSVFNPDIIDHVEAVHGGFPAEFGGNGPGMR
jgi:outer membrane cobalamin receptor